MAEEPHYLMVKRRFVVAWLIVTLVLFLGILASFQYANWVDRKSNQQWCGIIDVFLDTYKTSPPPTEIGRLLETEFKNIREFYKCK